MITLTEAYDALMSAVPGPAEAPGRSDAARADAARAEAARPHAARAAAAQASRARPRGPSRSARPGTALGAHGDPAYAYYKQGFINFSLAIHGVAEINRRIAAGRVPPPNRATRRRYDAAEDIRGSLDFLREAHGYFARVVQDHGESMWAADARMKLRRIENFTDIYRRILANLRMR